MNWRLVPVGAGHREAYLELEAAAAEPYERFVYDTTEQADRVRSLLFEAAAAEWAPPGAWLAISEAGQVGGGFAVLPAVEVQRRRLRSMRILQKAGHLHDAALVGRMRAAAVLLAELSTGDWYLPRIAVSPAFRGQGCGAWLLGEVERVAREGGGGRVVLEVSAQNRAALALYVRHGYAELGRATAEDLATFHRLTLVRMARPLR